MSESTESCQSCKFWHQYEDDDATGACRRFPPVDIVRVSSHDRFFSAPLVESEVSSEFPDTDREEWCGEYVKGEVKP